MAMFNALASLIVEGEALSFLRLSGLGIGRLIDLLTADSSSGSGWYERSGKKFERAGAVHGGSMTTLCSLDDGTHQQHLNRPLQSTSHGPACRIHLRSNVRIRASRGFVDEL